MGQNIMFRYGSILALIMLFANAAQAGCYSFELREFRGRVAYDGDTIYISMPQLPGKLENMSVLVLGVDTPEIRGQCKAEKDAALLARTFLNKTLLEASKLQFCSVHHGKYGGRIIADVLVDGVNLADLLIDNGHARAYDGGAREGWCE